ncbi:MAG TPA: hypothetical protein VNX70_04505 [Bryobacteraceae bacterium]|nr:hypothetical protein [Bryobacteraceae bacterium]
MAAEPAFHLPADVPDARLPGGVIPNPVKQDVLLELCRALHSYLMKYLVMIRRGHVPTCGAHINKDTKNFIRYFLPKGVPLTRASQKYDPAYTDKVRLVGERL